jgi:transcriptional regulator GlxA family with amidase domain
VRLWLRELARAGGPRGALRTIPARILEVRRHIDTHFRDRLAIETLASMARLSVSRFCELYKAHLGVAPLHYAQELRLRRAAYLLGNPTLSVGEVAQQVGIDDPFYFSRLFRRRFGRSPRAYREPVTRRAASRHDRP